MQVFVALPASVLAACKIIVIHARRGCLVAALLSVSSRMSAGDGVREVRDHSNDSPAHFRHDMPKTIRGDHPAIVPVAAAIRAVTSDPLNQLVMVNDVTHLLVDYDDDLRVYGRTEFHATLDEMIARRREAGWIYLRDDCDGRAVFAAHLLAALGIPWRLEASYWKHHAWVVARVNGVEYDLLEFGSASEKRGWVYRSIGHRFVRPTKAPPYFAWRRAWRERTASNLDLGKRLGIVELDSKPEEVHERFATDWTRIHPDGNRSPFDPRTAGAEFAAFPYADRLRAGGLVDLPAEGRKTNPLSTWARLGHNPATDSRGDPRAQN